MEIKTDLPAAPGVLNSILDDPAYQTNAMRWRTQQAYAERGRPLKLLEPMEHQRVQKLLDALANKNFEALKKSPRVLGLRIISAYTSGILRPEFNLLEVAAVYDAEPLVRKSIARKINLWFKQSFSFIGEDQALVDYIRKRFKTISYVTGIPTLDLFKQIVTSLLKYSNAFVVKVRDPKLSTGIPHDGLAPVAGYFPVSALNMFPFYEDGKLIKWVRFLKDGTRYQEFDPRDVIHLTIDREPDFLFGKPRMMGVIEDVAALRRIEENVEVLIAKFLFPVYQLTVGTPEAPCKYYGDASSEIDMARVMVQNMEAEGMLITSERFNLEIVGARSEALQVDKYLAHFKARVYTGLGVSAVDMGEGDCYDTMTETLTEKGWRFHHEIDETKDKIATFNPLSHEIEYHVPEYKFLGQYTGDMFRITGKFLDMKITPHHDMWVSRRGTNEWEKMKAFELHTKLLGGSEYYCQVAAKLETERPFKNMVLPLTGPGGYQKSEFLHIPLKNWAKFLGIFISEGCLDKFNAKQGRFRTLITQNPGAKFDEIVSNLEVCGFKFSVKHSKRGFNTIVIYGKQLYRWLEDHIGHGAKNKNLPAEVFRYSIEDRQQLINGLMLGDGSYNKGSWTYYTSSPQLASDVHRLLVLTGYDSYIRETDQPTNSLGKEPSKIWRVSMNETSIRLITQNNISIEKCDEPIYCYRVRNHLFITRRNGHVAIQGNTANRATADNISQNLKDEVIEDQVSFSSTIQQVMLGEMFLEHPNQISALNAFDQVKIRFANVDLDNQIKLENHVINLWNNDLITDDEARQTLGRDIFTNEDKLKTQFHQIQLPLAIIGARDEPWTNEAKELAAANTKKALAAPAPGAPGTGGAGKPAGGGAGKIRVKRPGTPASRGPATTGQPENQFGKNPGPTKAKSSVEVDLIGSTLAELTSSLVGADNFIEMAKVITDRFPDDMEREIILPIVEEALKDCKTRSQLRACLVAGFIAIADKFPEADDEETESNAEDC